MTDIRVRISRRRSRPRARTVKGKELTRAMMRIGRSEIDALDYADPITIDRPIVRGECLEAARPCGFVGCKFNLYLDVNPDSGSIKLNFPELEPHEMIHSCSLDAADDGPQTLDAVGSKMNLTRERTRQLELRALQKLNAVCRREP